MSEDDVADLVQNLAATVKPPRADKGKRPPREKSEPETRWGNMPICERCWVLAPEKYEGRFPDGGAPGAMVNPENPEQILVREPVRFKGHEAENKVCGFCGFPTWAGIFIRQDLNTIDYPPEDN